MGRHVLMFFRNPSMLQTEENQSYMSLLSDSCGWDQTFTWLLGASIFLNRLLKFFNAALSVVTVGDLFVPTGLLFKLVKNKQQQQKICVPVN